MLAAHERRRIHPPHGAAWALAIALVVAATACRDQAGAPGAPPVAATHYWEQPDSTVIGLGDPSDVKALTRDNVWVADRAATTIFSLKPKEDVYTGIGMGEHDPVEVKFPVKIAVDPEFGLAAFDGQTNQVDLFSLGGELIRSFTPGFTPAMMSFSRDPVGYTFGVAPEDSAGVRRPVVIRTGMRGETRDTLLSAGHGPEALRAAVARQGETSMAPSQAGMWVWSRVAPDTVFDIAPREVRRLVVRDEDTSAAAVLSDPSREMLWMVHLDSTGVSRYSAYDTRSFAYLGQSTVDPPFRPAVIKDGVVMGYKPVKGGIGMIAFDLHAERFERE